LKFARPTFENTHPKHPSNTSFVDIYSNGASWLSFIWRFLYDNRRQKKISARETHPQQFEKTKGFIGPHRHGKPRFWERGLSDKQGEQRSCLLFPCPLLFTSKQRERSKCFLSHRERKRERERGAHTSAPCHLQSASLAFESCGFVLARFRVPFTPITPPRSAQKASLETSKSTSPVISLHELSPQ
jgi:hypothetical protein